MGFDAFHFSPPILRALAQAGYTEPTPIQQQAIPAVAAGRDLIGIAQTGTGKTAAFALPILQKLMRQPVPARRTVRVLVVTPTRELALQIYENFCLYGRFLPLRSCVVFGGVSQKPQEEQLAAGVDILVATPGRLNDLYGQGIVVLDAVQILVLDEADRMLDMGFIHDVRRILSYLPAKRQTLLFSATMPPEVARLADTFLHDPQRVEVTPSASTVEVIRQSVFFVDKANKKDLLIHLLQTVCRDSTLVFVRTKHGADRLARLLGKAGIQAAAIHGNKSQTARQKALGDFKDRRLSVLIATDIAARGIDIEQLPFVVNYDLPEVPETYVHRIGRTGRAGCGGTALSFCCFDELPYWKDIEKLTGKKVPVVEDHPYPMQVMETTPKMPRPPRVKPAAVPKAPSAAAPDSPARKRRRRRRRTNHA